MLKQVFRQSVLLVGLITVSLTVLSHDTDGFYVIPTGKVKVIERELCNGTPVGSDVFSISANFYLETGDVYSTNNDFTIEITGVKFANRVYYTGTPLVFRRTIDTLPNPNSGTKGPFYALNSGNIFMRVFYRLQIPLFQMIIESPSFT